MIKLWGFFKGILIQDSTDRTKQISVEIDSAATTATRTTLKSAQTADRTVSLPDATDTLVGKSTTDVLTNKSMDGDNNTFSDIGISSLKTELADAAKFILRDGSGNVVSGNAVPDGTVVGDSDTQVLTNKTIDGTDATGTNTITADASDITYDNTSSGLTASTSQAAIDEVEGRVDTIESNKIDGPGTHADNVLIKTDGVDTNVSQVTGIAIDDSNNVTGVNDLTINGDLTVSGTTTTVDTANLNVTDSNITINDTGNDASAEGAGLTIERTGTDGSIVYADALASKFKLGAVGAEVEIADVATAQVLTNKDMSDSSNNIDTASADSLTRSTGNQQVVTIPDTASPDSFLLEAQAQTVTNKDIDGGTASNTSRITIPQNSTTNLAGLTRKEGTIAYDTDLDTIVYDDGTAFNPLTSDSGQGGINYVTNPDAESNSLTGWNTYNDASGAVPINGTGGTAAAFTLAATALSDLRGDYLFRATVSAGFGDPQGEGFSTDFAIDKADTESTLNVSFDYRTITDYETGFLKVYVYDIDNATLLGEVNNGYDGEIQLHTAPSAKFTGQFSTTDSLNYRLIFHYAVSTANGFIFDFDNVSVGPVGFVPVNIITEWQSYIPTFQGFGTPASVDCFWRRVGSSIELSIEFQAGTNTGVEAQVSLPPGLTVDPSVIATPKVAGYWATSGSTSGGIGFHVLINGGDTFVNLGRNGTTTDSTLALNGNTLVDSTINTFFASVPIAEFSVGNVVSNTELTQKTVRVTGQASTAAHTNTGSYQNVSFTEDRDTHDAYDGTTFTAPRDGFYNFSAYIQFASNATGRRGVRWLLTGADDGDIPGNLLPASATGSFGILSTGMVFMSKGGTAILQAFQDSGGNLNYGTGNISIMGMPDFSNYGVVNPNTEYLETIILTTTTTSAAGTEIDAVGSDLPLTEGTWDIGYELDVLTDNVSAALNTHLGSVRLTDSGNVTVPRMESLTGGVLAANTGTYSTVSKSTRITVTSATTYKIRIASFDAAATGTFAVLSSGNITGGLPGDDSASRVWARRVK